MAKKILFSFALLAWFCAAASAKPSATAKPLNYYFGLMEYYSGYCDKIGAKELEETDILMFSGKYALNEKNEFNKQKGLEEVNLKLQKILKGIQRDTHEYKVLLQAQLGEYDTAEEGFKCEVVNNDSCIDLSPLEQSTNSSGDEGNSRSIIERGLLFGKVSRIKIFFVNTEEFKMLKYPAGKKDTFLKSRTDAEGKVKKEVYAVINVEIVSKDKYKRAYDNIEKNIYVPGMENNYFMLARIKSIELYEDMELKIKLGNLGTAVIGRPIKAE